MRSFNLAFFFAYLLCCSCSSFGSGAVEVTFPYNESRVRQVMDSIAKLEDGWMYADDYSQKVYERSDSSLYQDTLYWVSRYGVDERAEALVGWLNSVEREGLKRTSFHLDEIAEDLKSFRKLKPDSCTQEEACQLMGRLELRLTHAYFRYAYGQRYGYTRAYRVFHNTMGSKGGDTPNRLFDYKCDVPTDSLGLLAIESLNSQNAMDDFLRGIQPTDSLFASLCREYERALEAGEKDRAELARLNIERSRWRYARPDGTGTYVFVNLPSYMLRAVNSSKNETLQMKICCGKVNHQTPLLTSNINKLEINPYWVVPSSIVRKEIAPAHTGDAGYFSRNRMVAIDNKTHEVLNAASLTGEQLKSGRYTIRQERGAGNSLGRLIFRFPNRFSVYLHDTNSPGAFGRTSRAVSHGCVRVQKPLDLAVFLMDNPNDFVVDKIRVAIDKQPLTDKGKKYKAETAKDKYMKSYGYDPSVPVYIDYFTLYPDSDGTIASYPDIYGYDKTLKKVLDQF